MAAGFVPAPTTPWAKTSFQCSQRVPVSQALGIVSLGEEIPAPGQGPGVLPTGEPLVWPVSRVEAAAAPNSPRLPLPFR